MFDDRKVPHSHCDSPSGPCERSRACVRRLAQMQGRRGTVWARMRTYDCFLVCRGLCICVCVRVDVFRMWMLGIKQEPATREQMCFQ